MSCGGSWPFKLGLAMIVAHALDDVERGGRAGLHDVHHDGAAAIDADDVGLRRIAVAHVGHVADVDHGAVHRLDGQVVQVHRGREGAELVSTWYSKRSSLMVPEGAMTFCAAMALTTSAGESPRACKRVQIEIDHDLALLAADRGTAICAPSTVAS